MIAIRWPLTSARALQALALAALLTVGLAACGEGDGDDDNGDATTMEDEADDDRME